MTGRSAFCTTNAARNVQPGWIMCSVDDYMKADWLVTSVATRVADRQVVVTMQLDGQGRTVESVTSPDEIVLRKIYRDQMGAGYAESTGHAEGPQRPTRL